MSQITKRALEQSLKNLLLKKPLNKITISDITHNADMAELADAPDLGSGGNTRAGSTPVIRTIFLYIGGT